MYNTATALMAEQGYEGTTMRAIAARADVSPGLLYRYFPSKGAVVMALYDDLSTRFADRSGDLPDANWPTRFTAALAQSLSVLRPHRRVLGGAIAVLLLDTDVGLFSRAALPSRQRVEGVFLTAVARANDPPRIAESLGRSLYLLHLGVVLWWVLDRSPGQRSTDGLEQLVAKAAPLFKAALWVPGVSAMITTLDRLTREGLYGEALRGSAKVT
ncbi:MAG: TetR family transcriptional regulator [Myxococcota bacterium]